MITYGAVDVRTNLPGPAAVVLDELYDVLADTCDRRRSHPFGPPDSITPPRLRRPQLPGRRPRRTGGTGRRPAMNIPDPPPGWPNTLSPDRPRSPAVELLVPEPLDDPPADDVLTVDRLRQPPSTRSGRC